MALRPLPVPAGELPPRGLRRASCCQARRIGRRERREPPPFAEDGSARIRDHREGERQGRGGAMKARMAFFTRRPASTRYLVRPVLCESTLQVKKEDAP